MSEKKKVIYVKDLVIKAENVRIERERHRLFGGREHEEQESEEVDFKEEHNEEHKEEGNDRPPFSWI